MAIPRIFISSTFYDLKQVREDIERFVRDLGYEPVRNETGNIGKLINFSQDEWNDLWISFEEKRAVDDDIPF